MKAFVINKDLEKRFPALKNTSIKMASIGEGSIHEIGSCWRLDKEDLVLLSNVYNANKLCLFLGLTSLKTYWLIPSKLKKLEYSKSVDYVIYMLERIVQDNGDEDIMKWLGNAFSKGTHETPANYKKYLCYSLAAARKNAERFGKNIDVLLDDFIFFTEQASTKQYNEAMEFLKYIRECNIPSLYKYVDPDLNGNWRELLNLVKNISKTGKLKKGIEPFKRQIPRLPIDPLICYLCNNQFVVTDENNPDRVRYYWKIIGTPINIDINNKDHVFCSTDCENRYHFIASSIESEIEFPSMSYDGPELDEDDEDVKYYRDSLPFIRSKN